VAIILYEPTSAVVHRFQSAEHVLPQWRMQLSSSATDIDLSKMGVPSVPLKGSDPIFNRLWIRGIVLLADIRVAGLRMPKQARRCVTPRRERQRRVPCYGRV
jgi:hypothetical protein